MSEPPKPPDDPERSPPSDSEPLSEQPTLTASSSTTAGPMSGDIPSPLPIGSCFGPYRILRLLGCGGMGAVYEAEHQAAGRRVALKVLTRAERYASARSRFLREGRLAAQLSHPHTVYIYGTEEIEGRPVITMERVTGGTLRDRVQEHGPLPVREAVDAILQAIEGLEAAAAAEILHRDVKPSNCFVEEDGTVKIGDFGLSISTEVRDETQLTATGTVVGTPSYASPEQLQGKKLDVRSDLYSVGATLHYLLTGKAPFEGSNMVQLLSAILQEDPPSPRRLRPEIPRKLARVILRCLEKKPSARYARYADLARDLFPFSASTHVPAELPRRFAAGFSDLVIQAAPVIGYGFFLIWLLGLDHFQELLNEDPVFKIVDQLLSLGTGLLYFGILEGTWGTTPGKVMAGLRVVGPHGDPPGVLRALLRASIFLVIPNAVGWILSSWSFVRGEVVATGFLSYLLYAILLGLLFVTARQRNGFAALHDRWTGTRVVRRFPYQAQHLVRTSKEPAPVTGEERIGPYHVLRKGGGTDDEIVLGWDPNLRRQVWIRSVPEGTPALPLARQELGRPGRLRWLDGRQGVGENWDAFEATDGRSLASVLGSRQPWDVVRHWLVELAEELQAGLRDGSLPGQVGLDRIWLTPGEGCKLLDFPAPDATETSVPPLPTPRDDATAQTVLLLVARSALEGRPIAEAEVQERPPGIALPLHAREFLEDLRGKNLASLAAVIERLNLLLHEEAAISRRTRLRYVVTLAVLPGTWGLIALAILLAQRGWENWPLLIGGCLFFLIPEAVLGVVWGFALRGGLLLSRLGIVVVRADGSRASPFRTLARSIVGWSPLLLLLTLLMIGYVAHRGPDPDRVHFLSTAGAPSLRSVATPFASAPVTVHYTLDYGCDYCADHALDLEDLVEEFPDEVRVVFKQRPPRNRAEAFLAAEAALAAHAQGRFAAMHWALLDHHDALSREQILELGRDLGLDMDQFQGDLNAHVHAAAVERDLQELGRLRVRGNPTVFVNGWYLASQPSYNILRKGIKEELEWIRSGNERPERKPGYLSTPMATIGRFLRRFVSFSAERSRWFGPVVLLLSLAGAIWFVAAPGRSLQDRVAGTYLVRR